MSIIQDNLILSDDLKYILDANQSIEKVIIPDTVTEIGHSAFRDCRMLKEILIPKNITIIGPHAFEKCENLTAVYFESNSYLERIEDLAFYECINLPVINLSGCKQLKVIDNWAFKDCDQLQIVQLPSSLNFKLIGQDAFRDTKLTHILADNWGANLRIGSRAFTNIPCAKLDNVKYFENSDTSTFFTTISYCFSLSIVQKIKRIFVSSQNPVMSLIALAINEHVCTIPEVLFIALIYAKLTKNKTLYEKIAEDGFGAIETQPMGVWWWEAQGDKWCKIIAENKELIKQITEVLNEIGVD